MATTPEDPLKEVLSDKKKLEETMRELGNELGDDAKNSGVMQQYYEQEGALDTQLHNFKNDQDKSDP